MLKKRYLRLAILSSLFIVMTVNNLREPHLRAVFHRWTSTKERSEGSSVNVNGGISPNFAVRQIAGQRSISSPTNISHEDRTNSISSMNRETDYNSTASTRAQQVSPLLPSLCLHLPNRVLDEDKMAEWLTTFNAKLEKYAQFHQEKLAHPSPTFKTLIWSCWDSKLCHGVGDQFYMIELAFLLAVVSNRLFFIHWDQVSMRTMQYLKPNMIDWSGFDDTGIHISRSNTMRFDMTMLKKLYRNDHSVLLSVDVTLPLRKGIRMTSRHKMTGDLLKGIGVSHALNTPAMRLLHSVLFRYLFTFQDEVLARVDRIQSEIGLAKPYIGTHLRTGFIGNEYQETHFGPRGGSPLKLIRDEDRWRSTMKCTVAKADSMLGKQSSIYLASDSYVVKELASRLYPDRIITLNMDLEHVIMVESKGNPELNTTSLKSQHESFEKREGIRLDGPIGMWVDFILLARSYAAVVSLSGFSAHAINTCAIPVERLFQAPKCNQLKLLSV